MIQYLWNAPLFDLAYDPRIEENLTVTIISSALESQRKSFKLQSILARQFSQVSILPRAFLHCSWVKELMSVMHNVFWNIPFFKKKIHDFYILDSYYIKQEPSFHLVDSTVKESEFQFIFWHVQSSLHCTQFHQKLASSRARWLKCF